MIVVRANPSEFTDRNLCAAFEGGAVYTAERDGKFYIIQDESTMWGLLDPDDQPALMQDLWKVLEFDTKIERSAYLDRTISLPSAEGLAQKAQ